MYRVEKTEVAKVTKIQCPDCKERVPMVGLLKDSVIEGLTFRCARCRQYWKVSANSVKTEKEM